MIKIYGLIFFIFVNLSFSYSCNETAACPKGNELFKLICFHIDNKTNKYLTPVEQLENISKKMESFEEHMSCNSFIKLYYANYLCSQYAVKHGLDSKVDINNQDAVTKNYIKGLGLYSQVYFSPIVYKSSILSKLINEMHEYLFKLKIGEVWINDPFKILFGTYEYLLTILKSEYELKASTIAIYKTKCVEQLNILYNSLKQLNNTDILDALFAQAYHKADIVMLSDVVTTYIKYLHDKNENISEYMNYIYSETLAPLIVPKKHIFYNNTVTCHRYSVARINYLMDYIKDTPRFSSKNNEYLYYDYIAKANKFFKNFQEAIPFYEHALSCKFWMKSACKLAKCFYEVGNYKLGLEVFSNSKSLQDLDKKDRQILKDYNHLYLNLLELNGYQEDYEKELFQYNQEAIENRLKKNKKYIAIIKKNQELKNLKEEQDIKREQNREANRVKTTSMLKKKEVKIIDDYNISIPFIGNSKKEYAKEVFKKEKTHGVADPSYPVKEVMTASTVEKPFICIEQMISGNPLKIFRKLFGPYERCPTMDDKQLIHPDDVTTLMKALDFPYSFSGGKDDHTKGAILYEDAGNIKEYMIIIPYRVPGIHPHYIKSLREIFTKIGFYPADLEKVLRKAGLLK